MSLQIWLPLNKRNDSDQTKIINNGLRDDIEIKHETGIAKLPNTNYWYDMCYGNGKFVTICNNGANIMAYSTDGITWNSAPLTVSDYWQGVCYGNGKFVAVAYNSDNAAYSIDGITWTETKLPLLSNWRSICYGGGKFVAIAYASNVVTYSTDGVTWTKATILNTASSANWQRVCCGDGKFVAIAQNSSYAAYSTDGVTWTKATLPNTANWRSICYGNGKFVAAAWSSNIAAYSTDGVTWTKATLPNTANWQSICYGNGKFVAIAQNSSYAAYSIDGINWKQIIMPSAISYQTIAYGNGKFVTTVYNSDAIYYSTDGITWTNVDPCPVYTNAADRIGGLAADKRIYVEDGDEIYNTDKISIAFRLYCSDHNGTTIISYYTTDRYLQISVSVITGSNDGAIQVGTAESGALSDSLLIKNTWNHVAITINDDDIKIYINGKYSSAVLSGVDGIIESDSFIIISNLETAGYKIQDYRIYDEILLPEEIEELALDVIAHYPLDDIAMMNCPDEFCGAYNSKDNMLANVNTDTDDSRYVDIDVRYDDTINIYINNHDGSIASKNITICKTMAVPFNPFNKYYIAKMMFKLIYSHIRCTDIDDDDDVSLYLNLYKYEGDDSPVKKQITSIISAHNNLMVWKEIELYTDKMLNYVSVYNSEENRTMFGEYVNGIFKEYRPYVTIELHFIDNMSIDIDIDIKNLQLMAVPTNKGYIPFNFNTPLINLYRTTGFNNNTYRVCYGNGKFVATAYNSNIAGYSTDGINWKKTTLPASGYWGNLCYGNGKFVAICANWNSDNKTNIAAYSTDGIAWTKTTLPTSSNYQAICYGNGKFVTITHTAGIGAYSTDGITWTQFVLPSLNTGGYIDITYGNGKFIMIGYNNDVAAYSTDGITWTEATLPDTANWQGVCYGNGKFVAVAHNSDIIAYSTDGITWRRSFTNSFNSIGFSGIIYGNGYFIAYSQTSSAAIAYSTDGLIWGNYYSAASPINWAAYHNGVFVFACTNGIYVARDKYYLEASDVKSCQWGIGTQHGTMSNKFQYRSLQTGSIINNIISYQDPTNTIIGGTFDAYGNFNMCIPNRCGNKMSDLFKVQNNFYSIDTITCKIWKLDGTKSYDVNMKETPYSVAISSDLTKVHPITDRWNNIIAILPDTAIYGSLDSINNKTSIIDSKYYGNYISENIGNISIFVSQVALPDSQLYCGVCVITNETGIEKVFNIVLPVRPPYIDIIIRKEQFIVIPASGNKLCISKDGSKWDSITVPYNKTWTCAYYDIFNLTNMFLLASSDKNVYYTYDLVNWHNLILNPVPDQPIQSILISDNGIYLYTKPITNNDTMNKYSCQFTTTASGTIYQNDVSDYNIKGKGYFTADQKRFVNQISPSGLLSPAIPAYGGIKSSIDVLNSNLISTSFWIKTDWRNMAIAHTNIICDIHFEDNGKIASIGPHYSEFYSDKWYLIALIINQNTNKYSLYINATQVLKDITFSFNLQPDCTISYTGNFNDTHANKVVSYLSDIKIYGKLLTQEDVEHIYNSTAGLSIYKDGGIKAVNYTENSISENLLLSENNYSDFEFYKTNGIKTIINPSVHNRIVKYTYTEASDNIFSGLVLNHELSDILYSNGKVLLSFYAYSDELTEARIFTGTHLDNNDAHHLITLTKPNQEKILNRILFEYNGWSWIYIETDHKNGDSIYIDSMSLQALPDYDDEQMYLDQYGRLSINEITESDQYKNVEIVNGNIYTNKIR